MTQDINTNKKSDFKFKKVLRILLIILAVILVLIVSVRIIGKPYDKTNNIFSTVVVESDDNTESIAQKLEDASIIEDASGFCFLSNVLFYDGKFKEGSYYLSPSMSFNQIARTMANGITTDNGFEIPAGMTIEQTADSLEQAGYIDKEKFINTINTTDFSEFDFVDSSIEGVNKLEGFLYPGVYDIDSYSNEEMIITTILNEFNNSFNDQFRARASEMGMSIRDIIIVASIIEKETNIDKEKSEIAAVIYNKLNLGMEFEGGYPTDPICSPGRESIKAALYPKESDNTYYILSDKLNGQHEFTDSLKEYKKLNKAYSKAIKEKESAEGDN